MNGTQIENTGWIATSHNAEADVDDSDPRGLTGLMNIGNTCYANAALQVLNNCVPLAEYFKYCGELHSDRQRHTVSLLFRKLVVELWSNKRKSYVVPSTLLASVRLAFPIFRGFSQQDSQEFLRCLLDLLHEDLKQPVYAHECVGGDYPAYCKAEPSPLDVDCLYGDEDKDCSPRDSEYETADSSIDSVEDERPKANHSSQRSFRRRKRYCRISERINDSLSSSDDDRDNYYSFSGGTFECVPSPSAGRMRSTLSTAEYHDLELVIKRKPVKHRSIVSEVFDGKVLSSVQCLSCRTVSRTVETFQDLSLPIPSVEQLSLIRSVHSANGPQLAVAASATSSFYGLSWIEWIFSWLKGWFVGPKLSLEDCMAAFFAADELKGDDMYSCDKCKKLRNGTKFCRLLALPEVLCVHLKRFKHEFMYSSKICTRVSFPLTGLDVKQFLHKDCHIRVTTYDLFAIICHHGSAGGGHYTAYCLNFLDNHWYEMDDASVTRVDLSVVENSEAYVLFYRKNQESAEQLRQQAAEILRFWEKHRYGEKSGSGSAFYISREWMNRFNTFAEPGAMNSFEFLCKHGGVPPAKVPKIDELCAPFPEQLWNFLAEQFGCKGPVCTSLAICLSCQREHDILKQRRNLERNTYLQLVENTKNHMKSQVSYAICPRWFRDWEDFVLDKEYCKYLCIWLDPPGPIDNSTMLITSNEHFCLRQGSNPVKVVQDVWAFLLAAYGGSPEIVYSHHTFAVNLKPLVPPFDVSLLTDCRQTQSLMPSLGDEVERRNPEENHVAEVPTENAVGCGFLSGNFGFVVSKTLVIKNYCETSALNEASSLRNCRGTAVSF